MTDTEAPMTDPVEQWVFVQGKWNPDAKGPLVVSKPMLVLTLDQLRRRNDELFVVPLDNIKEVVWQYRGPWNRVPHAQSNIPLTAGERAACERIFEAVFVPETRMNALELLREVVPRVSLGQATLSGYNWWFKQLAVTVPYQGPPGGQPQLRRLRSAPVAHTVVDDLLEEGGWPKAPKTLQVLRGILGTVPRRVEGGRLEPEGRAERLWAIWRWATRTTFRLGPRAGETWDWKVKGVALKGGYLFYHGDGNSSRLLHRLQDATGFVHFGASPNDHAVLGPLP